jgi:hypothetical protein
VHMNMSLRAETCSGGGRMTKETSPPISITEEGNLARHSCAISVITSWAISGRLIEIISIDYSESSRRAASMAGNAPLYRYQEGIDEA